MTSSKYAPPWRQVQPDGSLGPEYGPKTATTYAKHMRRYKQWAYRRQAPERPEAQQMHEFFRAEHSSIPESEADVYRCVYVHRMSLSDAADDLGISRSSVQSYLRRLRKRMSEWQTRDCLAMDPLELVLDSGVAGVAE